MWSSIEREEEPEILATDPELTAFEQSMQVSLADDHKEYLKVLEYDADNVNVLNNLAWLYHEAGNPEAIKYAEGAHELAPERAEITDTLGWLLVEHGEVSRGLVLLQEAAVNAPHMPEIRYHMVVALDKAGRRDEARKELDRLLRSGEAFPERDKAKALRDQWGG